MLPSNTPPDGDFVRYIEKLTAANAQVARDTERTHLAERPAQVPLVATQPQRQGSTLQPDASPVPAAVRTDASATLKSFLDEFPVLTHLKWLVVLWIVLQLLGEVIPAASYLLIPALLGYAIWVAVTASQRSSGALFTRLRELLRAAAEEARKAQQTHQTKQPQPQQPQALPQKPSRPAK